MTHHDDREDPIVIALCCAVCGLFWTLLIVMAVSGGTA